MFKNTRINILSAVLCFCFSYGHAQDLWKSLNARPSTLGLEKGDLEFKTKNFNVKLLRSSQTVAVLQPVSEPSFDFTPNDRLELRSKDGLYHLGDINLRVRSGASGWKKYSTAARRAEVTSLNAGANVLASADLTSALPADIPLTILRSWETSGSDLILRFKISNKSAGAVEIGALGIPMVFNNILQDKSLDQAHATNVFSDPYIGMDAGYLQVCRLKGKGPVLLVLPEKNASFEAYNPLLDDPTPRGITFEGFHEWMVHSKAYAENEWKNAEQWNVPTSKTLQAGENYEVAIRFVLADSIKNIESQLVSQNSPVAIGIPGYVLPRDVNAKLFLKYSSKIKDLSVSPAGALTLSALRKVKDGWSFYELKGNNWGRCRLVITYADGTRQSINYKVIDDEQSLNKKFGSFLTNEQYFNHEADPFKRSGSIITYDYETKQQVVQDNRVWISGLSDEGGAGGWLAAIMKQLVQPDKQEVEKLEKFVNHTLWGGLQHNEGPSKYGVKKSLFYYEPDKMPEGTYSKDLNWKVWSAWPLKEAESTGRSYNYPHVAAAHWVLYRLARNYEGLVTAKNWQWYLGNAFNTGMAMTQQASHYAQFGQMEGTVFLLILKDLKDEGYTEMAAKLESSMRKRADIWKSLNYPFGSEMPWDSTGQEEVYMWSDYFGHQDKAQVTLDAILAYMPTVPHWGYNGSARRYWDFLYGGKLQRVERQLHHYGSGLNAIPVLHEYRKNPGDLYLLRVGYGGLMGSVSNITEDGFGPAAFHSYPSTLKIDGLSGDYGSNYFGYAVNTSAYLLNDKRFGWLGFGGNISEAGNSINMELTTAAKSKVFIAPAGLWIELSAGQIDKISYNAKNGDVLLTLKTAGQFAPNAFIELNSETDSGGKPKYELAGTFSSEHGFTRVPLRDDSTTVKIQRIKPESSKSR